MQTECKITKITNDNERMQKNEYISRISKYEEVIN